MKTETKNQDTTVDVVCSYFAPSAAIKIDILRHDSPVTPDQLKTVSQEAKAVGGLGDAAYWDASKNTLTFTDGGVEVAIDISDDHNTLAAADAETAAEALARSADSRL